MAVDGVLAQHFLGRVGIPLGHRSRVDRQSFGEVPLAAVGFRDPRPGEHFRVPFQRRQRARVIPWVHAVFVEHFRVDAFPGVNLRCDQRGW